MPSVPLITRKAKAGLTEFTGLRLLPPPPLYRPFQLESEKSDVKKQKKSKPSGK